MGDAEDVKKTGTVAMIKKPFESITREDIQALVQNAVPESRTLDYKLTLPGASDSEKYEFYKDISAFSNASGGDIVYGVRTRKEGDKAIPECAEGLNNVEVDSAILRLEAMIRDGIAPRISARTRAVDGFQNGPVIVVRIPDSWQRPHMIRRGDSRFYSRDNRGNYPLDVTQIRSAFALSDSLPEKIRRFRDDRLARIVADETPIKTKNFPIVVLHLLPIAAIDPVTNLDIGSFQEKFPYISPLGHSANNFRTNFDGYLTFNHRADSVDQVRAYLQIFRTGAFETVATISSMGHDPDKKIFNCRYTEASILSAAAEYLTNIKINELSPPIFVMVTLLGIKGYRFHTEWFSRDSEQIDRDTLLLPDILIEEFDQDLGKSLRPAFDALWQSGGFARSPSYNPDGDWQAPRAAAY